MEDDKNSGGESQRDLLINLVLLLFHRQLLSEKIGQTLKDGGNFRQGQPRRRVFYVAVIGSKGESGPRQGNAREEYGRTSRSFSSLLRTVARPKVPSRKLLPKFLRGLPGKSVWTDLKGEGD